MSKQITYIIDEQSLRNRLTNITAPMREDAWARFDSYATAHARPVETSRLKSFNIPLSRNTLLPAAFGVIVIFFSFLLFNFISINPKKANLDASAAVTVPLPQVTLDRLTIPAEKPQTVSTEVTNQVAVKVAEASIVEEKPSIAAAAPVIKPSSQVSKAIVADESILNASASHTAQKNVKRRSADILGTTQLEEIRPTAVTEDMDPEIRPN